MRQPSMPFSLSSAALLTPPSPFWTPIPRSLDTPSLAVAKLREDDLSSVLAEKQQLIEEVRGQRPLLLRAVSLPAVGCWVE